MPAECISSGSLRAWRLRFFTDSYAGEFKFMFRHDTFLNFSLKHASRCGVASSSFVSNTSWHHIARDFPSSSRSFICVSIQFRVYKKMIFISGGCHVFINILTRFSLNNWLGHKFFRETFLVVEIGNVLASDRGKRQTFRLIESNCLSRNILQTTKEFLLLVSFILSASFHMPLRHKSWFSKFRSLATPRGTRWRQDVNFNAKS